MTKPWVEQIVLDKYELRIARWLGKMRDLNDKEAGVEGYENTTPESDDFIAILGVKGELAFAKMMNLYPPLSQDLKMAGKPDFYIDAYMCDVKSTTKIGNDLMVKVAAAKNVRALYALMVAIDHNCYYMGYALHDEIIDPLRIYTPQPKRNSEGLLVERSPFYKLPSSELHKAFPTAKEISATTLLTKISDPPDEW